MSQPPQLVILGRQPEISLAELSSLFPGQVTPLGATAAFVAAEIPYFERLGGSQKLVRLIATLPTRAPQAIMHDLPALISPELGATKSAIGLSWYGFTLPEKVAFSYGLELKKQLRSLGKNPRIVPGGLMGAAQIQHNQMLNRGADIVIVRDGNSSHIGLTQAVQAIDDYAKRDFGRPARSAKVGMLPPKLAQIMINLTNPPSQSTILDPFCGTGVVLQEALLMGFKAYGTDIEKDLIESSRQNLDWLKLNFSVSPEATFQLAVGDATNFSWQPPIEAVVSEGYLGPALTKIPDATEITQLSSDATDLTLRFFSNLRPQLQPGVPICFCLPAWRTTKGLVSLDILDQICALGYTLNQFSSAKTGLVYKRPDQLVARQLITIRSS